MVKGKRRERDMTVRFNEVKIDDPRRHPRESVQRLRRLLTFGAEVCPEASRPDFYELTSGSEVFYFHVSPVTRRVLLLAIWEKTAPPREIRIAAAARAV
jgi:hypothetical protein